MQQVDPFCLFNFPFLFDAACKARVMHLHTMLLMSHEFEDSFIHSAWVYQTQKALNGVVSAEDIEKKFKIRSSPFLVLEVRRQHLVEDTLTQLHLKRINIKKPLKVRFVSSGEDGVDQGGVQKEFFQAISDTLLDPTYGMFTYSQETRFSWFNAKSLEPASSFEFAGIVSFFILFFYFYVLTCSHSNRWLSLQIFGLAVYNGVVIGVNFPLALYKRLLNITPSEEDLEALFPSVIKGFRELLEFQGDVESVFCLNFEVTVKTVEGKRAILLKENGMHIPVTNENRAEYVRLYTKYLFEDSVEQFFEPFKRGFLFVCSDKPLQMCRPEELERLLCGHDNDYDFQELEDITLYDDGYHPSHPTILSFWRIAHAFNLVQKRRLLTFVTASDRIPLKGFSALTFVIQRNGPDSDRLPTALTCFGRLLLPEYSSEDKLRERLVTAIENSKGFGLV